jgi:hypothetical protein
MSHRSTRILWTGAAAALLALAVVVPRARSSGAGVREIHLVARDMTYYVDGRDDRNPTLHVSPGERVRIRLSNRDPGMTHDFGVPAWRIASSPIGASAEIAVEFTAPPGPADVRYACTPHGEMMHGTIHVQ